MMGMDNRMTHKERVQMYYSMLLASPALMTPKIKDDDPESKQDAKRRVQDFADACFETALSIDARFEKMNLEET